MDHNKKWMSVTEAAEYVSKKYRKVTVSFIRQLVQREAVHILPLGKHKLVEASDLDAYIERMVKRPAKKRKS